MSPASSLFQEGSPCNPCLSGPQSEMSEPLSLILQTLLNCFFYVVSLWAVCYTVFLRAEAQLPKALRLSQRWVNWFKKFYCSKSENYVPLNFKAKCYGYLSSQCRSPMPGMPDGGICSSSLPCASSVFPSWGQSFGLFWFSTMSLTFLQFLVWLSSLDQLWKVFSASLLVVFCVTYTYVCVNLGGHETR